MLIRPVVPVALVREYAYAYAAVSPQDGALDCMLPAKMDTLNAREFLDHVSQHHADDYVEMVVDGASSHRAHDLHILANMPLMRLPPYSPELSSAERLWEEIREKGFANRDLTCLAPLMPKALVA